MIHQRTVLALKAETTEGTAVTLVAADKVLCEDLDFSPDIEMHERNQHRTTLSRDSAIAGKKTCVITGKVAMKGSGTTGTTGAAPDFNRILLCCGLNLTTGNTGAIYYKYGPRTGDPNIAGTSYHLKMFKDGKLISMVGCRGTGKLNVEVAKPAYFEFEISGALQHVTGGAMLTGGTPDATNPVPSLNAATAFSWHAYEALVSSATIDIGNTLAARDDMNAAAGVRSFSITERDPKGTFDPEEVASATFNFYDKLITNAEGVLTFKLGTVTGNKFTVYAPAGQSMGYSPGDREGIFIADQPTKFNMSSTDGDEFYFLFE